MGDETITESEIWADIDKVYWMPEREPGDIDIPQFAAHYGISVNAASRRMKKMAETGKYEIIEVVDESNTSGKRKVIRKVKK